MLLAEGKWFSAITLASLFGERAPAEQGGDLEQEPNYKKFHIPKKLKASLLTAEARITLIKCAVKRAERGAKEEYRNAHRPAFLCDHCDDCFICEGDLLAHQQHGRELHKSLFHEIVDEAVLFQYVDTMFKSEHGRRVNANRLIFCSELSSMEGRVKAALSEPFRPYVAELISSANSLSKSFPSRKDDEPGRRHMQVLNGMMVQGFDASSGVRAVARKFGLHRQHLAPVYQTSNNNKSVESIIMTKATGSDSRLGDILKDLQRWREIVQEPLDTVFVPDGSLSALVCFEWSGFAKGKSFIIGEVRNTILNANMVFVINFSCL